MSDNQDQVEYWNGEVGQRWARRQRDLDAVFAPLTGVLFENAALKAGERVLDVGCGAGETALIAARRVGPAGSVVAADISAPMLAVARDRVATEAAGAAPIDWIEADAENDDLGAARFDHALSRFGVMFFADSKNAFTRLRHALVPGGRLTFLCWRGLEKNPWAAFPRDVIRPLIADFEAPAPDAPGPFRFADDARLREMLAVSGFIDIAIDSVERSLTLGPTPETAARFAAEMGPAARMLRDRDDALKERARDVLTEAFDERFAGGPVTLDASCWLVRATA